MHIHAYCAARLWITLDVKMVISLRSDFLDYDKDVMTTLSGNPDSMRDARSSV